MNAKDKMIEAEVYEDAVGKSAPCPDCAEMEMDENEVSPTFFDGSHDHCPDCGEVFEMETYPYCKSCRVRWD